MQTVPTAKSHSGPTTPRSRRVRLGLPRTNLYWLSDAAVESSSDWIDYANADGSLLPGLWKQESQSQSVTRKIDLQGLLFPRTQDPLDPVIDLLESVQCMQVRVFLSR